MKDINLIIFLLTATPFLVKDKEYGKNEIFKSLFFILFASSLAGILNYAVLISTPPPLRYLLSIFIAASVFAFFTKVFSKDFPAQGGLLIFYIAALASSMELGRSGMLIDLLMVSLYFCLYFLILISIYDKLNRFTSKAFDGLPVILIVTGLISTILSML